MTKSKRPLRKRPTDDMNSQAKETLDAHRIEVETDHGRKMPTRSRIPVTDAKNLDNVEHLIPEGYVGRWVLTDEIEKYKQGGYDHVEENAKRPSGKDFLHLMIIPEEWHKEDEEIRRKKAVSALGQEIDIDSSKGEYTDNLNNKAVTGKISADPFEA